VLVVVAASLTLLVGYLLLWPVPVEPRRWSAPPSPGYAGAHAANRRLADLSLVSLGPEEGPEHVAPGPDGRLYVSVESGRILRMNPDGSGLETFADTGGRVLGFAFDAAGRVLAADAMRGLLLIGRDGQGTLLADTAGGEPIRYANSVVVAADGKVYLTDASARFAPADWGGTFEASLLDILEQSATGRVLEYDPATGRTRVVARGLSFANGIAAASDGRTLFVAETGRYRVWRIDRSASDLEVSSRSPLASVLLDRLPGYPDNLMRGLDGRIWLGLVKPRSAAVDALASWPSLRKATLRLPRRLWPVPPAHGHVIAFTDDGAVVEDLQDPSGAYAETTGALETPERLYVMSLHAPALGWLTRGAGPN
jgi:sugar lactone lactonase YvrE